jgi:hypothetical protein
MSKKLSDQQIESLYDFCRKHYVPYYDLQIELVDHLAAGIEERWKQDDSLSFDDALHAKFKLFGIHGFSHIKKEKKRALQRKYRHIQWKLVGEYYTVPKIFMTIAITLLLYTGFRLSNNNNLLAFTLLSVYCMAFLGYYFLHYKKTLKLNLAPGKKFIISDVYRSTISAIGAAAFLPIHLYNIYLDLILSFLITFYGIILIVMAIYVPKRIKEDFESEFPQFVRS